MAVKHLTNNLDYNKCADLIGNRFDMVLVAAQRARELRRGSAKMVATPNGPVVSALQEIESGKIGRDYLRKLK
jgi:DNA-directed RNA polymerase omega subunit